MNYANYALLCDVQVNVPPGPTVLVDGRRLQLVQFHWHRSSEHTLDGRHYAMELHLVHREPVSGVTAQNVPSEKLLKHHWLVSSGPFQLLHLTSVLRRTSAVEEAFNDAGTREGTSLHQAGLCADDTQLSCRSRCLTGRLAVLAVMMQAQSRGFTPAAGGGGAAAASVQPLSIALDSAPQTARDPSAPAVFNLAPLLPAPREFPDSRPYIRYDGVDPPPDWLVSLWQLCMGANHCYWWPLVVHCTTLLH